MAFKFGDLVATTYDPSPCMVLGEAESDFKHVDDYGDLHEYEGGYHVAVIRLAPNPYEGGISFGTPESSLIPWKQED